LTQQNKMRFSLFRFFLPIQLLKSRFPSLGCKIPVESIFALKSPWAQLTNTKTKTKTKTKTEKSFESLLRAASFHVPSDCGPSVPSSLKSKAKQGERNLRRTEKRKIFCVRFNRKRTSTNKERKCAGAVCKLFFSGSWFYRFSPFIIPTCSPSFLLFPTAADCTIPHLKILKCNCCWSSSSSSGSGQLLSFWTLSPSWLHPTLLLLLSPFPRPILSQRKERI